ncbi:MAG: divalent-cation tolerance protein CutA [Deltaproteobacteria bacterium]|nr:divalent-cation tolerance protein CutA [Deltaproteobacteria bacterium]
MTSSSSSNDDDVGVKLLLCTVPTTEVAKEISQALLRKKLCACINVIPGVRSFYQWEGTMHDEQEVLLVVKSTGLRSDELCNSFVELHPYDVPEVLVLDVESGSEAYLKWVRGECLAGFLK